MFSNEELGEILNRKEKVKKSKKEKKDKREMKQCNLQDDEANIRGTGTLNSSAVVTFPSDSLTLSTGQVDVLTPQSNHDDVVGSQKTTIPTIIFEPKRGECYPIIEDTVPDEDNQDPYNANSTQNTYKRTHTAITMESSSHLVEGLIKASVQRKRTMDLARIQNISLQTPTPCDSTVNTSHIAPIMTDRYRKFKIEAAARGISGDTTLQHPVSLSENDYEDDFFYSTVVKRSDPSSVLVHQDSVDDGYDVMPQRYPVDSCDPHLKQEKHDVIQPNKVLKDANCHPVASSGEPAPLVKEAIHTPDTIVYPSSDPRECIQQLQTRRFNRKRDRIECQRIFFAECCDSTTPKLFGLDLQRVYRHKIAERLVDLMNA